MPSSVNGHLRHDNTPQVPAAAAQLTGVIRRTDGTPAVDATVTLIDAAGRHAAHTRTATDGTFAIDSLRDAQYVLVVSSDGSAPSASNVVAGRSGAPVEIVLAALAGLGGRVRAAGADAPIADAVVTLINQLSQVVATVRTDADGRWSVTDQAEGEYTMIVTADGLHPVAESVAYTATAGSTFDVTLLPAIEVSGTVTDGSQRGFAIGGSQVSLLDATGAMTGHAVTDAAGRFVFADVAPGDYTVIASGYAPVAVGLAVEAGRFVTHEFTLGVDPTTGN